MAQEAVRRPEAPGGVVVKDYAGAFINVRDERRVTTGQPAAPENVIHVFGGSTVFSSEVPDWFTIPSLLQQHVRQRWGDRFAVVNHGIPGFTVTDQVQLLRTVDVGRGDVVFFYDGTNEVYHWIFHGNADPEIARRYSSSPENWSRRQRITHALWTRFNSWSVFIRRFCDVTRSSRWSVPRHLRDEDVLAHLLDSSRRQFAAALREAHSFSQAHGATFVHALQPTLFTQRRPTEYEKRLADNHNIVFEGLEIAHRRGYAALGEELGELDDTITTYDLRDALDSRPPDTEHFTDDCHVTHVANASVARRMFEILTEQGPPGPALHTAR